MSDSVSGVEGMKKVGSQPAEKSKLFWNALSMGTCIATFCVVGLDDLEGVFQP